MERCGRLAPLLLVIQKAQSSNLGPKAF